MAALTTLTQSAKLLLANSLQAAAAVVYKEIQHSPTNYQTVSTAQLAATKTLLDQAQG